MVTRRSFLAFGAALALAGCAEPLLDQQVSSQLSVADVRVTADSATVGGREISVPGRQIEEDVRGQVFAQLRMVANGSRPVIVEIDVARVQLVSPAQALVIGSVSTITGVAQVIDANTGEIILEPTEVKGSSDQVIPTGGLIGAALKAGTPPEKDYQQTIAGFAFDVRRKLWGE